MTWPNQEKRLTKFWVRTTDMEYDLITLSSREVQINMTSSRPLHNAYEVRVVVNEINTTLDALMNETRYFHYGLPTMNIPGLFPFRNVSVTVFIVSHFGYSKPITKTVETLGEINVNAPSFEQTIDLNCTAVQVSWQNYAFENWRSRHLNYILYWRQLDSIPAVISTDSIWVTSNTSLTDFESRNMPGGLVDYRTTDLLTTSYNVTDLKMNTGYHFVLQVYNEFGLTLNCSNIFGVTQENIPYGPPINVSGNAINSTSITLVMKQPEEHLRNGVILGYQVTYWTNEDAHVSINITRSLDANETNVILWGLRKFFDHNITVRAFTKIGLGPASNVTVIKTLEDVPSAAPLNFTITTLSHDSFSLSWKQIPYLQQHSIMRNFTVTCGGMLANGTSHLIHDVSPAEESRQEYEFSISQLFPNTAYDCMLDGCNTLGCGPKTNTSNITFEYYPSGTVQSISQTSLEMKESLHINFTDLLVMDKKGNITKFNISLNKIENLWDTVNDTTKYFIIDGRTFELSMHGLDNFTEYEVSVTAYTLIGPGPTKNSVFRTATNVPSGSPYITYLNNISSSAINVKFDALDKSWSEGPITGYVIYYQLTEDLLHCDGADCLSMNGYLCQ
uniref:Fibronectin type-III domain-containing protein n=1 Tax=Clytia hemisphaerica TaxID=252671 RepID=A0A7M5X0I0_9CNID